MFARLARKGALFGIAIGTIGGVSSAYVWRSSATTSVLASTSTGQNHQTQRQARFNQFASCELDGQYLMTPIDFLESVLHRDELPAWTRKRTISQMDFDRLISGTPSISKGSSQFFRTLQNSGIISYPEYLFLVTILTKSKRGIEIALRMLDKDNNKRLCRQEFLLLEEMVNNKATAKSMKVDHPNGSPQALVKSTLLVHFFGRKGTGQLTFDQVAKFMQDLQVEVLELEFAEFSRGMPTIAEECFGRLLLRNTCLEQEEVQKYLNRLNERITEKKPALKIKTEAEDGRLCFDDYTKGITVQQFVNFGLFLNNLDDFAIALRIHAISGQPVSEDEFQRAVRISTGHMIDPYVVHTIFQLFDKDGDGKLSYEEFIDLMKDRRNRGFVGRAAQNGGWEGFKHCIRKEMTV